MPTRAIVDPSFGRSDDVPQAIDATAVQMRPVGVKNVYRVESGDDVC